MVRRGMSTSRISTVTPNKPASVMMRIVFSISSGHAASKNVILNISHPEYLIFRFRYVNDGLACLMRWVRVFPYWLVWTGTVA